LVAGTPERDLLLCAKDLFINCYEWKKAPASEGQGKLSRAELSGLFGPIRSALTGWAERFLVALPTSGDLFVYAKDLFVEAKAPQARHQNL
jgi:hypothetical protein